MASGVVVVDAPLVKVNEECILPTVGVALVTPAPIVGYAKLPPLTVS